MQHCHLINELLNAIWIRFVLNI